MVTAWRIKIKTQNGSTITFTDFKGDGMTEEILRDHYENKPRTEVIKIKQLDPQIAFKNYRRTIWRKPK